MKINQIFPKFKKCKFLHLSRNLRTFRLDSNCIYVTRDAFRSAIYAHRSMIEVGAPCTVCGAMCLPHSRQIFYSSVCRGQDNVRSNARNNAIAFRDFSTRAIRRSHTALQFSLRRRISWRKNINLEVVKIAKMTAVCKDNRDCLFLIVRRISFYGERRKKVSFCVA